MSIDLAIAALTAALIANTAALEKAAAEKPAAKVKAAAEKKADEPKVTQEQVNAALIKIKDSFGMPEAKTVIKEFGLVDKMADIKPAQFKAVLDGAVAKYDELTAAAEGGDEKGDDL